MTDIEIRTRSVYDSLSPAEQKVARYFLHNMNSVFDDPISALAEKSGVSQVVWVRFCKSLGYTGLKDMKKNLVSQLREPRADSAAPRANPAAAQTAPRRRQHAAKRPLANENCIPKASL